MPGMNAEAGMLMNLASGTSAGPESWSMPMKMVNADGWNLMFMGQAFIRSDAGNERRSRDVDEPGVGHQRGAGVVVHADENGQRRRLEPHVHGAGFHPI